MAVGETKTLVTEQGLALVVKSCRTNGKGGFGHSKGIEYMKAAATRGMRADERVGAIIS